MVRLSWPFSIALVQPSSMRRFSSPTIPSVRRNRYSGIVPSVSMPGAARKSRSCSSMPARWLTQAAMPSGVS